VHVTPGTFLDPRVVDWTGRDLSGYRKCMLYNRDCYSLEAFMNDHGDYQPIAAEGGLGNAHWYDAYSRQFYSSLTMLGQLNDVRPANSPRHEWYYQYTMRVVVDVKGESGRVPISNHAINQPFNAVLELNQPVTTIRIPTSADSFHFCAGAWPLFSGTIIATDWHEHSLKWQASLLVLGTPAQLGLGVGKFVANPPQLPILTATTGFADNKALFAHVMSLLDVEGAPAMRRPRLVCKGLSNVQLVAGTFYDRLSRGGCTPTAIYAGDAWTQLGFNGDPWQVETDGATATFSMSQGEDGHFYEHNYAWIYYVADDRLSHYSSYSRGVSYVDRYTQGIDNRRDFLQEALQNGSDNGTTLLDELLGALLLATFWWTQLSTGDLGVPGLSWVAALLAALVTIVATTSSRRGAPLCTRLLAPPIAVATFLVLAIAIANSAAPPHVYFVNFIEAERLIAHDNEVDAANAARAPWGVAATQLPYAATVLLVLAAARQLALCCRGDAGKAAGADKVHDRVMI